MHLSYKSLLKGGWVVYALTAWFSAGYHHPDEHFQLLEFANYKLGNTSAADMPWELGAQIRPALQPTLAMGWMWLCGRLGIDIFWQAFALRLLGAMLSFYLYVSLIRQTERDFERPQTGKILLGAAIFLWYMPYISVRFSSESWSAICLLAATLLLLRRRSEVAGPLAMAGFLMGLAFVFRFQSAFAAGGLVAWLFFQQRVRWTALIPLAAGGLSAVALGFAVDTWFYGAPVFTPWRYFEANIVHGKAAEFGVSPWWFYIPDFLVKAIPPVSIVLLFLLVAGIRRQPRHIFTWLFLPFLLVHMAVGHKEIRFLFPVAFPALFLMAQGWEVWADRIRAWRFYRGARNFLLTVNGIMLLFASLKPAHDFVGTHRFLYHYAQKMGTTTLYAEAPGPYHTGTLRFSYYEAPGQTLCLTENFAALRDSTGFIPKPGDLIFHKKLSPPPHFEGLPLRRIHAGFPDWILRYNFNDWQSRTPMWSVYRVENQ